ncbi:MAG: tetratricopeptide repeat protein, partial [Bacteroidota bacterium]|nr:tetratricopeptide repeat protein [Bacteroidota bacterium]
MNSRYQNALELFQRKDYLGAEKILIAMHDEIPNDPEVAYFLAVIYSKSERFQEAISLFDTVLGVNNEHTEAHYNIALAYQNLNMFDEALYHYGKALEQNPFLSEALNNSAIIYKQLGDIESAEKAFTQAIKSKPNNQNAVSNLGGLISGKNLSKEFLDAQQYYNNKDYNSAKELLNKLYVNEPTNQDILNLLGMVCFSQNNLDESIVYYEKILSINKDSELAYYSLGVCHQGKDDNELALKYYKKALEVKPDYLDALNNLGLLYVGLKNFDEAEKCYLSALESDPLYFNSITNLGALKVNTDKVEEGLELFDKALSLAIEKNDKTQMAVSYGNLGFAKLRQLDLQNAIIYFNLSIELDSDNLLAHYNKGEALLMSGQFEEGWKEYEWRTGRKDFGLRHFDKAITSGADLKGKKVLVYAEQGIGDALQFERYLTLLKEHGAYIIFECDKSLFGLMKSIPEIDEIIERNLVDAPVINYDYDIPLLSLPLFFNTTLENIPSTVPYLQPEKEYMEKWTQIIKNSDKLKIGIVWAGSPTHSNDRHRSVKLNRFLPLFSIEGTEFFSLQKGFPTIQARDYQLMIKNLDEQINSFSDTAAAIAHLDLVITVDTSVAHLAGAMGKPVWVLLPYVPDWRWMLGRSDSPWYPTMRLFRQPALCDWDSVFNSLKSELLSLTKPSNTKHSNTKPSKIEVSPMKRSFETLDIFLSKLENEAYAEPITYLHSTITNNVLNGLFSKLTLKPNAKILDIGCGQGPALEIFTQKGFQPVGITLSDEDILVCREKGFNVQKMDQSFLKFENESFDFIWSRHCIEHSFAPYYTLFEYYRVLKPGSLAYIEMPAPDTEAHHETNPNHYSVLPKSSWISLMQRCGFHILDIADHDLNLKIGKDMYWGFLCMKPTQQELNSAFVAQDRKDDIYLALTSGENFGWGVCSKYLRKELADRVNVINVEELRDFKKTDLIDGTVLHALTNQNFFPLSELRGKKNYGYTFFESELTDLSVENAKKYEKVIGGSTWNRDKMLEKGITNVDYLIQGIDPELFYPGDVQKNNDLFVIFSG